MLKEMYVKDFVLIDELCLNFDTQMSAFTGETGAGKSLLMDAIGVLKGERINTSMIKEGKEKAFIEGVFEVEEHHPAYTLLQEAGYDVEDFMFVASREFGREGKSVARINQRIVNVSFLKDVVSTLVDIHSQHDTQYLLNTKYHITLLDNFCNVEDLCQRVKTQYQAYKKIHDKLESALHEDYNEDDLEFLTFQLNEIDEADIKEHELEECEEESKRLMAFEKISSKVASSLELLEDEHKGSASLYEACREIGSIHEDDFFEKVKEKLQEAYYQVEEVVHELKDYMDDFDYDEVHFHELQERISCIHKIYRKYGPNVQALQVKREELNQKIDMILHRQDFITKQEALREEAKKQYLLVANELHEIRSTKAKELEQKILEELKDLQLPHARFEVVLETMEGNASGIDNVAFLISMNPGEPLKPLSTTASGGELSRFMLGLKTVFTSLQKIETIIFDEIDTGVSGSVAFSVGRKMKELANQTQVFCVTHLASVAACAQHHYIVEKLQQENTTNTKIRELNEEERIAQLAMISNNSMSTSAMEAAKELYMNAQKG
ncbi:DNA repair protein RecN [Amedibacillus sp. YH-ame10]